MALRYFTTGGTGNWSSTGNWALTSGGAGGQAVPTASDDVIFDAISPNCVLDTPTAKLAKSFVCSAYTGTQTWNIGLTVSGNVVLGSSMTILGTGNLTINATTSLTSNGKTFPNSIIINTATVGWADNWNILGNLTNSISSTWSGSTNLNVGTGLFANNNILNGATTPNIVLNGTGVWSCANGISVRTNLTINTTGTTTLTGTTTFLGNTLTYSAGTLFASTTAANLTLSTGAIVNLSAPLTFTNGTITFNDNLIFTGNSGFNISNFRCSTAGKTLTLKSGVNYTVSSGCTLAGTAVSHILLSSTTSGSQSLFTLPVGSVQDIYYTDAKDIDSSNGQPIRSFKTVLNNTKNWSTLVQPPMVSSTF